MSIPLNLIYRLIYFLLFWPHFFHPRTDESKEQGERKLDLFLKATKAGAGLVITRVTCDMGQHGDFLELCKPLRVCPANFWDRTKQQPHLEHHKERYHIAGNPRQMQDCLLNSSGQHSCAVGESTSRKMSHMVGFPRTSTAPLAKVLESALVEPRNIPR